MLVDYGTDSDGSGDEKVQKETQVSKLPSTKAVDAPKAGGSSAMNLPRPRRPLKITLEAPKRSADDDEGLDTRPVKKVRAQGAGGSSLLAMLPPPKNATPIPPKPNESDTSISTDISKTTVEDKIGAEDPEDLASASSLTLLPPSRIAKAKERSIVTTEPVVDFFSLESVPKRSSVPSARTLSQSEVIINTKSAAPAVKEFVPPEPTQNDEYPGYYQMPNGDWAMYDPTYYQSVSRAWQQAPSVEEQMRRRAGPSERVRKQWEGEEEDLQQVSAMDEASRTQAEIESTKSLTAEVIRAGPTAPNMKMTAARSSNRAKSRHQLSTLLTDAYSHRAEIEDKIAMAKRNRKESGNKYGF